MHLKPRFTTSYLYLNLDYLFVTFYLIRSFFRYHSVYEFLVFTISFLDAFFFSPSPQTTPPLSFSLSLCHYPFITPSFSLHHSLPLLILSSPFSQSLLPYLPTYLPPYCNVRVVGIHEIDVKDKVEA